MLRAVMPRALERRRVAAAAVALFAVARAACAAAQPLEYLYIEANEGGSSGGHVALRLGDDTFHFQQERGGLIRLHRDDAAAFTVRYALLGNRPIHALRLAATPDDVARIHDALARRLLIESARYDRLAALLGDVGLFAAYRAREPGVHDAGLGVPVRAAGYFVADDFVELPHGNGESPSVAALRALVGTAALDRRIAARRDVLARWQPRSVRDADLPLDGGALDMAPPTASVDYAQQIEALTALEVLRAAVPLRADALRAVDEPPLTPRERGRLAALADGLRSDLARLAVSTRADFGYPLLLGMARLAAIDASCAAGRLFVLDTFDADAPAALLPDGRERQRYVDALAAALRAPAAQRRADVFANDRFHELEYGAWERAANRLLEVEGARQVGMAMRLESGAALPVRAAVRRDRIAPPLTVAVARAELARARQAVATYRERLAAQYGYHLVSRNCVSEMLDTVDAALGRSDGDPLPHDDHGDRRAAAAPSRGPLAFIPFLSVAPMARRFPVIGAYVQPSYRQLRRGASPDGWLAALRESNTLTATTYHPDPRDSAFLFFTDQPVPLRPVLGAVNLAVGLADGAVGLLTWPLDRGRRLEAGVRGACFSLPELAFVNIRKGSQAWIEPDILATVSPPESAVEVAAAD